MTTVSIDFQMTTLTFLYMNSLLIHDEAVALFDDENEQYKKLHNPKRKKTFIGVRHLRNTLEINKPIQYKSNGKPFLPDDNKCISISHSYDFVAFAVCDFPIGIDMEKADRDATRIINKFVSEDEKNLYQNVQANWPLELWCAKEAAYKLFDIPGLSFKDEIKIQKREQTATVVYLSGVVLSDQSCKEFEVQLRIVNELLFAVALFKVGFEAHV